MPPIAVHPKWPLGLASCFKATLFTSTLLLIDALVRLAGGAIIRLVPLPHHLPQSLRTGAIVDTPMETSMNRAISLDVIFRFPLDAFAGSTAEPPASDKSNAQATRARPGRLIGPALCTCSSWFYSGQIHAGANEKSGDPNCSPATLKGLPFPSLPGV